MLVGDYVLVAHSIRGNSYIRPMSICRVYSIDQVAVGCDFSYDIREHNFTGNTGYGWWMHIEDLTEIRSIECMPSI